MITSYLAICAITLIIVTAYDTWRERGLWSALVEMVWIGMVGWGAVAVSKRFTDGQAAEIFLALAICVGIGAAFNIVRHRLRPNPMD